MKYDFETIIERHGKDALAVDRPAQHRAAGEGYFSVPVKEGFDIIPMWVADMNFPTVPTVCEAIRERIEHPAFGYFNASDAYFESIIKWQNIRNGVTGLAPEHIGYENGVLGGVLSALNVFCSKRLYTSCF